NKIAPLVAIIIPPKSKDSTLPSPMKLSKKPPTIAPTIPTIIVTRQPPGSLPGTMNLASAPAIKPKRIQDSIPHVSRRIFQSVRPGQILLFSAEERLQSGDVGCELLDSIWAHNLLHFLEESRGEWEGFV